MELLAYLREKFIKENIGKEKDDFVQLAVELAYADMSRHATGHREEIKEDCITWLVEEIKKYPDNESSFDAWHETKCTALRNELTSSAETHHCSFKGTIGRAQKIINMTFKYLLVLDDEKYKSIKNKLHMALDSYTLNWYKSIKPKNQKAIDSWSKLDNYGDYYAIQKTIRDSISKGCCYNAGFTVGKTNYNNYKEIELPNNVFEAEFIIWEGEKNKEVYKNTIKALTDYNKDKWFIGEIFDEQLKTLLK